MAVIQYVPFSKVVKVMTKARVTVRAVEDFLAACDEAKGVPMDELDAFIHGEALEHRAFLTDEE
ncbi:hypothetical protein QTQ07_004098 [Escherichia coli]|nr:hypothetical protein [Escherichia coli]